MMRKNLLSIFVLFIFLFAFMGCSPSLAVNIATTNDVSVEFSSGLGESLVQTLYSITDMDSQNPLFNKKAVAANLGAAGFTVENISVDNNNIYLKTKSSSFKDIVANSSELVEELTPSSVKLSFSSEKLQDFVSVLPEETVGYLDLLCAPVLTNEELSTDDYVDVLAAIYGKKLAQETLSSNFVIEISVGSKIKSIDVKIPNSKTVTNNNKARITIPLADFLCNLDESTVNITW